MPRGPKGQKRPADVIGNALTKRRLSLTEVRDKLLPAFEVTSAIPSFARTAEARLFPASAALGLIAVPACHLV